MKILSVKFRKKLAPEVDQRLKEQFDGLSEQQQTAVVKAAKKNIMLSLCVEIFMALVFVVFGVVGLCLKEIELPVAIVMFVFAVVFLVFGAAALSWRKAENHELIQWLN